MKRLLILPVGVLFIFSVCSSVSASGQDQKRSKLNEIAEKAIAGLIKQNPAIQQEIEKALGYAVANIKSTRVPTVGAGGGEGILLIKEPQQRIYFSVGKFDPGGGWDARSYKVLLVFDKQRVLDQWKTGRWEFQAGVEASAGAASAEGSSSRTNQGFAVYVLFDGGAFATVIAQVIRIKLNSALNEMP